MPTVHPVVADVTARVVARSRDRRAAYLELSRRMARRDPTARARLSCSNQAHAFAAAPTRDLPVLKGFSRPNVAIVSSYNDVLSAHQPYETYPPILKEAARAAGATAQFAGGVPAMCDGVTQGQPSMELSLFSREVIAMATAVALSHDVFDAALCLGICDKIVPGLVIGALHFGHLPTIFVPGGPMPTGITNEEKSRVRKLFAAGQVGESELLAAECGAYHSAGTCTFYGTANSNQMLMEIMGLHLPGAAFVNPGTPLRDALTAAAADRAARITAQGDEYLPICDVVDERAIVNGIVGLMATGGSTNHALHIVAMARAAGVDVNWTDFADLSAAVPLLARVYPNGSADVNGFHAAGGMGFVIGELIDAGFVHEDVTTVMGRGLAAYRREPFLDGDRLAWRDAPTTSGDESVLRPVKNAFDPDGGLKLLDGNLGRAVIKTSAVKPAHRVIEAPARVFDDQEEVVAAFRAGELDRDVVVVVRFQGPGANGMPELHKLTPPLSLMQDRGHQVAIVTDGRMSGASGRVPAAIHVTPECLRGGPLALVRDGDVVRLDSETGTLEALVEPAEWHARTPAEVDLSAYQAGLGRELFAGFRALAHGAEEGAGVFGWPGVAPAVPA